MCSETESTKAYRTGTTSAALCRLREAEGGAGGCVKRSGCGESAAGGAQLCDTFVFRVVNFSYSVIKL